MEITLDILSAWSTNKIVFLKLLNKKEVRMFKRVLKGRSLRNKETFNQNLKSHRSYYLGKIKLQVFLKIKFLIIGFWKERVYILYNAK